MKTTDLIPLILYQLVDGDKYGYEIVKQIEDASNGKATIKQPTLYSVLKKLEQGKFISSYWKDSEIGGKRHYYKLTPNGKSQLDTYPPFEQLLKDAMGEEEIFTPLSPAMATNNMLNEDISASGSDDANKDSNPTTSLAKEELSDTFANFEQSASFNNSISNKVDSTFDFYAPTPINELQNEITNDGNNLPDLKDINGENEDIDLFPSSFDVEVESIDANLTSLAVQDDGNFEFGTNLDRQEGVDSDITENALEEDIKINPINIDLTTPFKSIDLTTSFNTIDTNSIKYTTSNEPYNSFNTDTLNEDDVPPLPFDINNEKSTNNTTSVQNTEKYANIFDAIDYDNEINEEQNQEVQTEEITTTSLNEENSPMSVDEDKLYETATKFTDKVQPITEPIVDNKLYNKLTPNEELLANIEGVARINEEITPINDIEQVKYLNYVDFSTDATSMKRKKAVTKNIQKMSLTCASLLIMFIISIFVCTKYSFGKIYYICAIVVCLVLILYPIITLKNAPKTRLKYCSLPFRYSISRDFFIKLSMFLSLVIVVFSYNLSLVTTVGDIFALSNFANFLAPIMFGAVIMLDFVYNAILFKSYK